MDYKNRLHVEGPVLAAFAGLVVALFEGAYALSNSTLSVDTIS
jgi:hypothetical protein